MRITEIHNDQLEEGPVWQGIKGAVKGAFQGAPVAGAKAGYQQGTGQQAAKQSADVSIKKWNAITGQLQQAGQQATPDQLATFVRQQAPTAKMPVPTQNDLTPAGSQKYILTAVSQHIANRSLGTDPNAQQAQDQKQTEPQTQTQAQDQKQTEPQTQTQQAQGKPGKDGQTGEPGPSDADAAAAAATEPVQKPTMTKDQISAWITRNSEDHSTLKATLDAINAAEGGVTQPAVQPRADYSKQITGYGKTTMNAPAGVPRTGGQMPSNMVGSKPAQPAAAQPQPQPQMASKQFKKKPL
jgi:hypothetical protein